MTEEAQEAVEVEAPIEAEEAEILEEAGLEEDITDFGPDGPIEEEADEQGEEPLEEEVAEPTAESPPQPEPFQFRAYGKTVQVPGAVKVEVDLGEGRSETQIVMTEAAFQTHIHSRIPDPEKAGQREKELESQIDALNPEFNETVIRNGVFASKFDGLIELAKESPELFEQAIQNFQALASNWELEAKNAVLEAQAGRQVSQTSSASDEAKVQEWQKTIEDQLGVNSPENFVGQILSASNVELPPADVQMLKEYAWRNRGNFYSEGEDGSLVGNDQRLIEELEYQIGLLKRGPTTTKAAEIEEANKKAIEGKAVPPTRSAKGKQTGQGSEYVPPKDKEEYRKRMGRA